MIERLNKRYHLHGIDDLCHDGPISGDFQSHKVRHLMMGITACRVMKHLDHKARMSVTPRAKIRGFTGPRQGPEESSSLKEAWRRRQGRSMLRMLSNSMMTSRW
ncbi:hypothetical protein DHEL01_v202778 [Diaporthe helianthi]|uniref:Uncharacterized protein n=1 Tax=Diaporthe helianthi TaxID=158607 RepID=A0A2P5I8I4_DIAHE|nr:hypothetical protein DHEL01_v202778 [Diaporthe helianthi]